MFGDTQVVEIYSGIDPIYMPDREVRYWLEFDGMKSEELTEWAPINAYAHALCAKHDAVIIDRSDKDSGLLRSMLAREQR